MIKALWAVVVISAVALGISIFGTVVNNNDVRAQSARVSAIAHRESVDRAEIVKLNGEVRALSDTRSGTP